MATNISFYGSDSTLARSRLYAAPDGRLVASIFTAYGEVSDALAELMTRTDYVLQMREATVQVELIPETRFASVTKVTADTVISLGSTLAVTTALRVGQTQDRDVELALSVPDTLPAGLYQLEVGSVAALGDDGGGIGGPETLFGLVSVGNFEGEGEETLDEVFARLNKPDENVRLKARLTFVEPPGLVEWGEGEGEGLPEGGFDEFLPPDAWFPSAPPAPISTHKDVDLFLQGVQSLEIEVVD